MAKVLELLALYLCGQAAQLSQADAVLRGDVLPYANQQFVTGFAELLVLWAAVPSK